ncbi:MAG: SDR family oxidoreductase [Meiothermus sp.]|nr:SDR family oxidoreductase [Meiothermus sp.]
MRVLITGGTGYLGRVLLRQGLEQGLTLAATCHSQPPAAPGVRWHRLDILDRPGLRQTLEVFRPEVVVHTAYRKEGEGWGRVIVEGTANVLEASRAVGARLVHLSTDAVFDGEKLGPYTEADPPNPVTEYGRAKLEAERLVLHTDPGATAIRTSLIWGLDPLDPTSRTALDLAQGRAKGALFTDEYRSFVYAQDLAAAILELLRVPHTGLLHLGGAEPLSRAEFGQRLVQHHGLDPQALPLGSVRDFPTPRPRNGVLDSSRAALLLKTRLRGVGEVLASQG